MASACIMVGAAQKSTTLTQYCQFSQSEGSPFVCSFLAVFIIWQKKSHCTHPKGGMPRLYCYLICKNGPLFSPFLFFYYTVPSF